MPWPKGKPMTPEMLAKRSATTVANKKRRKTPVVLDGVTYWKCGRCAIYRPEVEFYQDGKTASGVSSQCRGCHCEGNIRTRNRDSARERNSEYMRRARAADPEKFRERERANSAIKRQNSPEKVAARKALNDAVKRGDVVRPHVCETCATAGRVHGHHDDYSKPLQVRWLCVSCHGREHRVIEFKVLENG